MTEDLKNIVECLIFMSESPITVERLKKAIPDAETADIRAAAQTLAEEYEARAGGFVLKEVAGGFQFRTRTEYHEWVKNLIQPNPVRLSKATLETLAIIAYKQPIIRSDIEHIRGVDCGGIIRTLLERKLVRILGRKEIPGRPLIYATTKYFLELFDLRNLKDLPSPKEIESLAGPPGEQEETGESADCEQLDSDGAAEEEVSGEHETQTAESVEGGGADSENTEDQDEPPEDVIENERSENGEPSDFEDDAVRDIPPEDETKSEGLENAELTDVEYAIARNAQQEDEFKSEGFENAELTDYEDAVGQDIPSETETKSEGFEIGEQLDSDDAADTDLPPEHSADAGETEKRFEDTVELDQSNAVPPLAELRSDNAEHDAFDLPDQDDPADAAALSPAPADENQTATKTQEHTPTPETKEPDTESLEPPSDSPTSLSDPAPEGPETDATPEKE